MAKGGIDGTYELVDNDQIGVGNSGIKEERNQVLEGYDIDGNKVDDKGKEGESETGQKDGIDIGLLPDEPQEGPPQRTETDSAPPVDFKSILLDLSNRGVIDSVKDAEFSVDGNKLSFDDINIASPTELADIIQSFVEAKTQELTNNKIDATDLSEYMLSLIEADKKGVNVRELIQSRSEILGDIEALDIKTKGDSLRVIAQYVSLLNVSKKEKDEFYSAISSLKDEDIIKKAQNYKDILIEKEKETRKQTIENYETQKKEAEKRKEVFKGELKARFSQNYKFNDKTINELISYMYDEISPSRTKMIDDFIEKSNNPDTAIDLILFLNNPDEFTRQKSQERVADVNKKVFVSLSTANRAKVPASVIADETPEGIDVGLGPE